VADAIRLEAVTKIFGTQKAVDSLSLSVPEGSIYGFIGPNGSGKTTTLRMILRIFQPDTGSVEVLGQKRGKTADDRLGYLPEERGLYKRMRVRAVLQYYARLKGHYGCDPDIDAWLERLGATEWAHKRVDMLSKGMAQKIQFIAAVVARPKLLILDEPFSGLDPVNLEVLKEGMLWMREQGTTVLFSTHDMEMAERLCDTIFMIFRGKKVLDGTLDAIQADYPADRIRVRFENATEQLPKIMGIRDIEQNGRFTEFRMENAQDYPRILRQLAESVTLTHFEVIRPSLHEIFVRIARPESTLADPNRRLNEVYQ
jgi:ABC-2 type transport system ATP-binding protein